jgi:hypothetical protein
MAKPVKEVVPDPVIHVFDTDIGPVSVTTSYEPAYDMEHLVRDRARSVAKIMQLSNVARMVSPASTPGPRAVASAYLADPIILEE